MSFSLQRRLLLVTGLILSLVLGAGGVVTWLSLRAELRRELDVALYRDICLTAPDALIEYWLRRGRRVDPDAEETSFLDPTLRRGIWLQVWNEEGKTVLRSRHLDGVDLPRGPADLSEASLAAPERERLHYRDVTFPDGRQGRMIAGRFQAPPPLGMPLRAGGDQQPMMHLSLVHSIDPVDGPLAVLRFWLVLSFAGCVLLAWWTIAVVLHKSMGPLRQLRSQIRRQDATRPEGRFRTDPQMQELMPVEEQLNQFVERVQKAMQAEQEFAGQAAHELGNPLAGLRATLEVALARARDGERDGKALQACHQVVLDMEHTVQGLLDLARLGTPDRRLQIEEVDLAAELRAALAALAVKQAELRLDLPGGSLVLRSDRRLLQRILHNLIDNALSYRRPATPIEVQIRSEAGRVCLEICNLADDLDPAFAERAFETFWRGQMGSPPGSHAGIGLSLTRRCVEALGGEVRAAVAGERVCMSLSLRRDRPSPGA